ncbi:MAG: hypothetical protein AB7G28_03735 [Pirellulales bacterium]
MAVFACALSGCWEEIHYKPPAPGAGPVATATPKSSVEKSTTESSVAADDAAGDFGDDVASQLAEEPLPAVDVGETPPIAAESAPPLDTATSGPAATTPATDSQSPSSALPNTRLAAWSLGSTLSLAALANDRAASADKVTGWFDTARQQAAALGTKVADLPPRPAADQIDMEGKRAMEYLFDQGKVIGPYLGATFGDDHNALFELALKSNILLVRYQPDAPIGKLLAAALSQASERAKLPPELVRPVLAAVEANAPVKEVRDAVFDMHANVDRYLSTGQVSGQP